LYNWGQFAAAVMKRREKANEKKKKKGAKLQHIERKKAVEKFLSSDRRNVNNFGYLSLLGIISVRSVHC
jgi:hypothetical protein